MALLISFFTLFILFESTLVSGDCKWDIGVLPPKSPIYYENTLKQSLLIPKSPQLELTLNQIITIACLGKGNTIAFTGKQEMDIMCTAGNTVIHGNTFYNITQLFCANSPTTDIQVQNTACSTGKNMTLGFTSPTRHFPLMEVCYDGVKETALYTKHTLHGKALQGAQTNIDRPEFRSKGVTHAKDVIKSYTKSEQLTRFTTLLGPKRANFFINSNSFLARGHLSPDGDFLFGTWASASYYLVNAAPQFQIINSGNWLKIENRARKIAIEYQEDMLSITGIHDVLQLPSDSNTLTDMYLMNNQMTRVPKWYWKVVYSEKTRQGIAFITSNNPFLTSISSSELLCPNICNTSNWYIPDFDNFSKGYTYCCDVNTLLSVVKCPVKLQVTGLINGIAPCLKPPCKRRKIQP